MKRNKLLAVFTLAFMLTFLQLNSAHAQADTGNGGNVGIGIMFGEPTGLSVKAWTSSRTALNIGAAWSLSGRNEAIHLHADYLFHSWFGDVNRGQLGFYYGIGARAIFAGDPTAGVRIPLGLNYVFENSPFDLFVEAVPILDLTPDTEFAGNGAFGIRYYF
ncbi:hypothetical protein [Rhodohalobacter sp. SW132]|uniref:hypothetical protein n=1 Tax=Rhodohalobacter sp. SW132 TaxID=2293433 RepID=UPI001F36D78D|nr:hypothetical protein [Rhodohalobacter sp. SW132]